MTKFFTNIKEFSQTYSSTVKIAWETDRSVFLKISLANALNGALVYPSLLIAKLLIDSVMISITTHDISTGMKGMIIAAILGLLVDRVQQILQEIDNVYSGQLSNLISEKIQVSISRKLNLLPVSTAEDPNTRNILQKVIDNAGRSVWSLIIPISTLPELLLTIISTAIPIITFQPLIIIPSIILAIPNIIIGVGHSKAQHALSTEFSPKWRVWSALEDFATKGRFLYENKILSHVEILLSRRFKLAKEIFGRRQKLGANFAKKRQIASLPLSVFETGTKLYLYYLAITQTLTLGTAQITSNAINQFISSISRLIRQANDIFQNYLFINDYETFMALPEENQTKGIHFPDKINQGIEFQHVYFKYPKSKNWILNDVSFKIDPADNLAIVGQNGAGKTTLIKLLCRFYEPQKGIILINGKNINDYNIKEYRFKFSALFQDFAQYPFSVEDNIRFGDISQKRSLRKIKQAAMLTGITNFIEMLPLKYQNPLDKEFKDGVEPSKGLWQRVALARILYRPSEFLILDEPTSNVDPQSEEEIFEQVLKIAKEKIIFLVSHRFSTVRKADKILVLEHGTVVEHGTHHELMAKNGRYKELFDIQAESFR
ncbi:MAG TPA: ABC transporter ATP-binding protein [Spirochaetia bacterium]|nr:ABC transporter ATP-binding protein [Spirochaetia bacterium]